MKKSSITRLLIIAGLLQGCASSVNPQGSGTREMLTGSKPLSLSSEQCPHGIGLIRLYKDTLDGNKIRYNAKLAYSSKPIEGKFNIYNLLDENNAALLQKGEKGQAKASIDDKNNSILIKISDTVVRQSSEKLNDATTALKATGGESVTVNDEISIRYNPKAKYYENWGEVKNSALSQADLGEMNKTEVRSVWVKIGKDYTKFPIPETIDGDGLDLDQKFDATIGTPLEIKLHGKPYDTKGMIYVQFTNGQKGKANATYNYIIDEGIASGETTVVPVPTTGMAAGEYIMNVFRSEVIPVDADEKTDGPQNFCMEVGTGFMGRVSVNPPKAK